VDYGTLVNSIDVQIDRNAHGIVFTNVEYAPMLEFGTSRMAKRPFFVPAAEAAWPGFEAAMRRILG
jgi:phage gpG-like protein